LEYRTAKKVKIHPRYKNDINYFPEENAIPTDMSQDTNEAGFSDESSSDDESEERMDENNVYEDYDENIMNKAKPPQKACRFYFS
jgi:hypothetical protein